MVKMWATRSTLCRIRARSNVKRKDFPFRGIFHCYTCAPIFVLIDDSQHAIWPAPMAHRHVRLSFTLMAFESNEQVMYAIPMIVRADDWAKCATNQSIVRTIVRYNGTKSIIFRNYRQIIQQKWNEQKRSPIKNDTSHKNIDGFHLISSWRFAYTKSKQFCSFQSQESLNK